MMASIKAAKDQAAIEILTGKIEISAFALKDGIDLTEDEQKKVSLSWAGEWKASRIIDAKGIPSVAMPPRLAQLIAL